MATMCIYSQTHTDLMLGKEILRKHCSKLYVHVTGIRGFFFLNPTWHLWAKFEF